MREMRKQGRFFKVKTETIVQRTFTLEADTRAEAEHIALANEAMNTNEKIIKKETLSIREVWE